MGTSEVTLDSDNPSHLDPDFAGMVGRFEITGLLGRGGMGVVLAARDPLLGRKVAIKVVPDLWTSDGTEGRARFLREAKAMGQLNHPNVVTVYEVGEVTGKPFIAMEYVDGVTLRAWQSAAKRTWRGDIGTNLG